MSHVDEGTLHAYLDGALDTLPAAEAERVRRHLAECDVCQARLGEERAVRDDAAAILAGVTPDLGELPSFEEVRGYAYAQAHAGTPGASGGSRLKRLAWAASVVLALGTGWLLRGGIPQPMTRLDEALTAPVPASSTDTPGAGESASRVGAAELERAKATDQEALPSATGSDAAPAAPGAAPPSAQGTLRDAPTRANEAASPTTLLDRDDAADAFRPADAWAAARQRRQEPVARGLSPQATVAEPSAGAGALPPVAQEARRSVSPVASLLAGRADALEAAGSSLVVPGLPVLSVSWLEEPDLAGAVRVLQLMEGGDTLELVHLPQGVDPSLLPAVGDGRTQVLAPRDGGWLVVRARASADVLSALLRRLDSGD